MNTNGTSALPAKASGRADDGAAVGAQLSSEEVWRAIEKASFAVVSHVSATGEPRSSGIVYGAAGRRLYLAVAPDSWKARRIAAAQRVAVTIPVRRGGLLSLLVPIPPATISFEATATVHAAGSFDLGSVAKELVKLLPEERRTKACIIELVPEGRFLTYGVGVSLMAMRDPALALARVPVSE
jgi:hypothetical protein